MADYDTSYAGRFIGGGKYELLEPVGAGAMGVVWLGRHVALDRIVAVKLLHKAITNHPDAHERFVREAQTASSLRHKHMVQVLDFGGDPETGLFLVMEYIEGKNLSEVMLEEGTLAPARALTIASQVLAGLAEAHELGIIHRDVKTANVMLLPMTDDDGVEREQAKVFDFGIATMRDAAKASQEIAGTPEYMSPEQVRGTDIDHRSDVYSVGILLYAMLTGQVPFSFEGAMDTMLAQVNKAPTPLRQKDPRFSEALDETIMKALAKSADGRFATARAFRTALLALPEMTKPAMPAPVVMEVAAQPMATVRAERAPVKRSSKAAWVGMLAAMLLIGGGLGMWAAGMFDSGATSTVERVAQAPVKAEPKVEAKVEPAPKSVVKVLAVPVPVETKPEPAKVAQVEVAPVEVAKVAEPVVEKTVEPAEIEVVAEVVKADDKLAEKAKKDAEKRDKERKAKAEAEKVEAARIEAEKIEAARIEAAKVEAAKVEAARIEAAKVEAAAAAAKHAEAARIEAAKVVAEPVKAPTFTASAAVANVAVQGSLPRSSVARALESARSGLEQCYNQASHAANRDSVCSAPVNFVIDLDGRVRNVTVGAMSLPGLSACATSAIARVRVKDRPDTGTVEGTFHLRFSPKEH